MLPFLQNFEWAFVRMDPVKSVALPVPQIMAIEVLGVVKSEPSMLLKGAILPQYYY